MNANEKEEETRRMPLTVFLSKGLLPFCEEQGIGISGSSAWELAKEPILEVWVEPESKRRCSSSKTGQQKRKAFKNGIDMCKNLEA